MMISLVYDGDYQKSVPNVLRRITTGRSDFVGGAVLSRCWV